MSDLNLKTQARNETAGSQIPLVLFGICQGHSGQLLALGDRTRAGSWSWYRDQAAGHEVRHYLRHLRKR